MNKCFITKLPSSVDNDNLPVLGQLRINWLKQSDLTKNEARNIGLSTNDSITVKVSGAHFTDGTLTSNLGNTKTITAANGLAWSYISNDADAVLTIDNKYSLKILNFAAGGTDNIKKPVYFNIEDIKYCTNLIKLSAPNSQVSGDISALSGLTNLSYLNLSFSKVSGDISAVSNLTKLTLLNLDYTQVSGKIDSLANLTKMPGFANLTGTSLTGDMSKIPAGASFICCKDRKVTTNFTWTAKGRQNATLLAMEGNIPFDTTSMDNMLIDQATCTFKGNDANPWEKIISVSGTRTSASDAAVTTLQNMGITITGVTKQA